jgi:hypothetical protein
MGSPFGIAWRRYRRNRLAVGSLAFVVAAIALCFPGAPLLAKAFGHGPDDPFPYAVSVYLKPDGLWSRVPNLHEFVNAESSAATGRSGATSSYASCKAAGSRSRSRRGRLRGTTGRPTTASR